MAGRRGFAAHGQGRGDGRLGGAAGRVRAAMDFADGLDRPVDVRRVNLGVVVPWLRARLLQLAGVDDEILAETAANTLELARDADGGRADGPALQVDLTAFVGRETARTFCGELWALLLSAQDRDDGIPLQFVEEQERAARARAEDDERTRLALLGTARKRSRWDAGEAVEEVEASAAEAEARARLRVKMRLKGGGGGGKRRRRGGGGGDDSGDDDQTKR